MLQNLKLKPFLVQRGRTWGLQLELSFWFETSGILAPTMFSLVQKDLNFPKFLVPDLLLNPLMKGLMEFYHFYRKFLLRNKV